MEKTRLERRLDLVAWNAELVKRCEAAAGMALTPETERLVLEKLSPFELSRVFEEFRRCRAEAIGVLELEGPRPVDGLAVPSFGFPQMELRTPRSSSLYGLVHIYAPWIPFYSRVLLYGQDDDPFRQCCELVAIGASTGDGRDISGLWDSVRRDELASLCSLAPLMKEGILLYLPTQRSPELEDDVRFGGTRADSSMFFTSSLGYQLILADLLKGDLLLDRFSLTGQVVAELIVLLQSLGIADPHNCVSGAATRIAGIQLPIGGSLDSLMTMRDSDSCCEWRERLAGMEAERALLLASNRDALKEYMDGFARSMVDVVGHIDDVRHSLAEDSSLSWQQCSIYAGFAAACAEVQGVSSCLDRELGASEADHIRSLSVVSSSGESVLAKCFTAPVLHEEVE